MFKVKVDKQTLSHRCQTAGKVSGGAAEEECVEPSSAASFSPFIVFSMLLAALLPSAGRRFGRGSARRRFPFVRCFHRRHHDLKARREYVRDR